MQTPYNTTRPIKLWAEDDRPREKLLIKGKESLSNAELLAILIGTGSPKESAVELARRILSDCQNNLLELSKLGIGGLRKFKGVGLAKAVAIEAAMELARRRPYTDISKKDSVKCSLDAYQILRWRMEDLTIEQCWVIFLNRSNAVINIERLSSGGLVGTVVDVRVILKKALEYNTTGLVLSHNHPSGNLNPSLADDQITEKLKQASKIMDISLIDHLIVTESSYYSYADAGKL